MEQAKLWDKQLELLELVVKVVEEVQVGMDKAEVLMEVIWLKKIIFFSLLGYE